MGTSGIVLGFDGGGGRGAADVVVDMVVFCFGFLWFIKHGNVTVMTV